MSVISVETLQKRLQELQAQREQGIAHINAVVGAIQVIEVLIRDSEKTDTQEPASDR